MPRKTNIKHVVNALRCRIGFNEAAARCRGKPLPPPDRSSASVPRFNEAAARCRGKLFAEAIKSGFLTPLQ